MTLKEYLCKNNMTSKEFAKFSGYHLGSVYLWARGDMIPQKGIQERIEMLTNGDIKPTDWPASKRRGPLPATANFEHVLAEFRKNHSDWRIAIDICGPQTTVSAHNPQALELAVSLGPSSSEGSIMEMVAKACRIVDLQTQLQQLKGESQ